MTTAVQSETLPSATQAPTPPGSAAEALARFRPFRSRRLAVLFAVLPWAVLGVAVVLEVGLAFSGVGFDPMFATGAVAAVLALGALGLALRDFPRTFVDLGKRGLLQVRGVEADLESRLAEFIVGSEALLNHRAAWLCGMGGLLIMGGLFWPFRIGSPADWADSLARHPAAWLAVLFYVVVYATGLLAGYLAWKPAALAIRLGAAGDFFDFDVSPEHPAGCGGLKSLGDLGLRLALIAAVPAIFAGGWAIALSLGWFVDPNQWKLALGVAGAAGALISLTMFLAPLTAVSQGMRRQRARVQAQLDAIGRQIDRLSKSLLNNAERLDPAEGKAQEEKLEFLRRVYARHRRAPVWPFDTPMFVQLCALQAVPVAGLIAALLFLR